MMPFGERTGEGRGGVEGEGGRFGGRWQQRAYLGIYAQWLLSFLLMKGRNDGPTDLQVGGHFVLIFGLLGFFSLLDSLQQCCRLFASANLGQSFPSSARWIHGCRGRSNTRTWPPPPFFFPLSFFLFLLLLPPSFFSSDAMLLIIPPWCVFGVLGNIWG